MGCRGRTVWNCTGLIMRYLAKEPKVGQGRGLGDFERNKSGKIEV